MVVLGTEVCCEVDSGVVDSDYRGSGVAFITSSNKFGVRNTETACLTKRVCRESETKVTKQMSRDYEFGDMVWGKVQSHPWWPGQIFDEALAVSNVRETKAEGQVLVAFFGDNSYGWFDPAELAPFDPYYVEKSKQTNARSFINAVEEADDEVRRRAALGLACCCKNSSNFGSTSIKGYLAVNVHGCGPDGLYTVEQIKRARAQFKSVDMLMFVKQLALVPCKALQRTVDWVRNMAIVVAYRRAVFEGHDETYIKAFQARPLLPVDGRAEDTSQAFSSDLLENALSPEASKQSVVLTTRKDQCKGYKEPQKPKNELDVLNVYHVDEQQQFPSSQNALPTQVSKAVLERKSASLPKKKHILCQREISDSGSAYTDLRTSFTSKDNMVVINKLDVGRTNSRNLTVNYSTSGKSVKLLKRPGELAIEKAVMAVKIKKSKLEPRGAEDTYKCHGSMNSKKVQSKSAGKSNRSGSVETRCSLTDIQGNSDEGTLTISPISSSASGLPDLSCIKFRPPRLYDSLLALAVSPLHHLDHYAPVLHFFLQFRSFVYEKNPVMLPLTDSGINSLAFTGHSRVPCGESAQDLPSASKPPKKRLKPEDYASIKCDRNLHGAEEISPGVPKKPKDMSSLSAEKEVGDQKSSKFWKRDQKETGVHTSPKSMKSTVKQFETSKKVAKAAMLVMQFPGNSSLPSVSELKARFARFGPFDSPPRLLWKFSMCQIVFKHEYDAKVACRYAVQNGSLFGNMKVHYEVQASPVPTPDLPKSSNKTLVKATEKASQPQKPLVITGHSAEFMSKAPEKKQFPKINPDLCWNKPQDLGQQSSIDMTAINLNRKFLQPGGQSNMTNQLAVNRAIQKPSSNFPNLISLSSHNVSGNCAYNFNKAASPPNPLIPHSHLMSGLLNGHEIQQFAEACNEKFIKVAKGNIQSNTSSQNVDVSGAMLNLLRCCSAILSDLKSSLGYVPYRL